MTNNTLNLKKFIGVGATRVCFEHPQDVNKCVKVVVRFKEAGLLFREIDAYYEVKSFIDDFVPAYEPSLVQTNIGQGLVCELFRDDDGRYSQTLGNYLKHHSMGDDLTHQMWMFAYNLMAYHLFFYDFNLNNFIVQIKEGKLCLKYTDLKSYNHYKPFVYLRLERVLTPLARLIMKRRLEKLFRKLGIK